MGRPRKWQANPMLQKLVQDARQTDPPLHWLDLQDANRYKWVRVIGQNPTTSGRIAYYRRLGIVEDEAIKETRPHVRFVEESYPTIDAHQFFLHILNTNRAIDPNTALSRLHVLPFERTSYGTIRLHLIPVVAHQITDGLTVYRWASHLARILNISSTAIKTEISTLLDQPETTLPQLLPPPQESLYPRRSPNLPRQRWHWLLTRILRHVRTPLPPGFQNPLRRTNPQQPSTPFEPIYSKVLDYKVTPPLNAGHTSATITHPNTTKLRVLCKKARISVGSGLFTLVAMTMMSLEERLNPTTEPRNRLPFIGSFPVNPRPFLTTNTTGLEDSCMLAFSDGVVLPFLPSDLAFAGRFKLLGRLAHRQLRQYQKRPVELIEEVQMGSRSPSQLLPALFCGTLERLDGRYDGDQRAGVDVQGGYPASAGGGLATCGVSSVGDVSGILAVEGVDGGGAAAVGGNADQDGNDDKDLVAKFESLTALVRPRDGEFLVGAIGDSRKDQFMFNVSFDANAIDDGRVWEWKGLMEGILDAVEVEGDVSGGDGGRAKL